MTVIAQLPDPHLTLVPGFRAAGVACGLKKDGGLDLALICADTPCAAAAVFTKNRVQAAPVLYDRSLIEAGTPARAIVINSGNANACTGKQGDADTLRMAQLVGQALHIKADEVLVMSTGVIGQPLPMDTIARGIALGGQALAGDGGHAAARAIMTTDTRPKEAAAQVQVGGAKVTIAGMCKGSGMIHPDMATMLSAIVTDAALDRRVLQTALSAVVERTFNMITVDGDSSTNDTVLLLANGQAGNPIISDATSPEYAAFVDGLLDVATTLSQAIVRDGEGATKFVTIQVTGAADFGAAKQVAKTIANSSLVKTAIYGQDANWGRVICAAGYSGIEIDPARLSLWMENEIDALHLVRDGAPFEIDEPRAATILAQDEVVFRLDLGQGQAEATVWTCDLTHEYVNINAHYRT
ncbi:MAG: bifunctional glutamate N-acetyltransferase/amino-acid acetyltransferase ArgJ [Anaerolineae bacterium]|nr:bifunctional glutamate N-acetyltransferase/amino-acid acetyltransferase ArgJ [Anaerolineae bacterium]